MVLKDKLSKQRTKKMVSTGVVLVGCGFGLADQSWAQSASLHRLDMIRPQPLTLENTSFTYVKLEPPREIKINDIITIIVDYKTQHISVGNLQRRKRSNMEAVLEEWIKFKNGNLVSTPFGDGNPGIQAELNNQVQTQVQLNSGDTVKFSIAATVVDIRPNGNLVLEAHQRIENNEDTYEQRLSGIVRREDVLPNNTVLSEDVAELTVEKWETGHVRDGYKRGWLLRLLDRIGPF
jgi:flagellar L-ring protein precursor FlgH